MKKNIANDFSFLSRVVSATNLNDSIYVIFKYFEKEKCWFISNKTQQASRVLGKETFEKLSHSQLVEVTTPKGFIYYLPICHANGLYGTLKIETETAVMPEFFDVLRVILDQKLSCDNPVLRTVFDNGHFPFIVFDLDGKLITASESLSRVLNFSCANLRANGLNAYMEKESYQQLEQLIQSSKKLVDVGFFAIDPIFMRVRFKHIPTLIDLAIQVLQDPRLHNWYVLIEVSDSTDNQLLHVAIDSVDEELVAKWEHMLNLFECAADPIFVHRANGEIIEANQTASDKLLYSKTELNQMHLAQLATNLQVSELEQCFAKREEEYVNELVFEDKNGHKTIAELKTKPIFFKGEEVFLSFLRDITQRVEINRKLNVSKTNYRYLLEKLACGIFLVQQGKLIFSNQLVAGILGFPSAELLRGKAVTDVLDDEQWHAFFNGLQHLALQSNENIPFEIQICNKRQVEVYIRLMVIPIVYNDIATELVMMLDITDQKETEKILRQEKERAERNDRMKSSFLASISHEIRTPLNSISGFSQLIETEKDMPTELRDKYLKIITQNSEQLLSVVSNIIEVAEINSGSFQVSPYPVRVASFFNSLHLEFEKKVTHVDFVLHKPVAQENDIIFIDGQRLRQAMQLLIDNAIKFTHSGFVALQYELTATELIVKVKDTGVGIAKEKQAVIFKEFTQGDDDIDTRKYGGTGVGLYIVKRLVTMLGGQIALQSEIGKGSTFTLWFARLTTQAVADEAPLRDEINWRAKCVLIVEDTLANAFYLEELFAEKEVEVHVAYNGSEAIELLKKYTFNLVLLDLQLPDMSGYQVLERIRSNWDVPVVAQTAYALTHDKKKVQQAGFEGYLEKPIKQEKLMKLAENLMRRWEVE